MPIERTLSIIKPDAVGHNDTGKIIDVIEQHGFTIIAMNKLTLDSDKAELFYTYLRIIGKVN